MKRFVAIFLIFLCLTFSVIRLIPAFAVGNIFTQGIYKLSDFNISNTGIFTIQNVSETEGMYLYILNENQDTHVFIYFKWKSRYNGIDTISTKYTKVRYSTYQD